MEKNLIKIHEDLIAEKVGDEYVFFLENSKYPDTETSFKVKFPNADNQFLNVFSGFEIPNVEYLKKGYLKQPNTVFLNDIRLKDAMETVKTGYADGFTDTVEYNRDTGIVTNALHLLRFDDRIVGEKMRNVVMSTINTYLKDMKYVCHIMINGYILTDTPIALSHEYLRHNGFPDDIPQTELNEIASSSSPLTFKTTEDAYKALDYIDNLDLNTSDVLNYDNLSLLRNITLINRGWISTCNKAILDLKHGKTDLTSVYVTQEPKTEREFNEIKFVNDVSELDTYLRKYGFKI